MANEKNYKVKWSCLKPHYYEAIVRAEGENNAARFIQNDKGWETKEEKTIISVEETDEDS